MATGLFEDAEIIHSYTRAQALADGTLVDVSETAREAGFVIPVAVTQAAYADCIAWNEDNTAYQDVEGRLWDVLSMARLAASRGGGGQRLTYTLVRIPNTKRATVPRKVELALHVGPGDSAEPVVTIMLPNED